MVQSSSKAPIWHPEVHHRVKEELCYVLIHSYKFFMDVDEHLAQLDALLGYPCTAYITYGATDVWLRFWADFERRSAVTGYLSKVIAPPDEYEIFRVNGIWRTWTQPIPGADIKSILSNYPLERLAALQANWPANSEGEAAISSKLVLGVIEQEAYKESKRGIRFFLFMEVKNVNEVNLIRDITRVIERSDFPDSLVSLVKVAAHVYVLEFTAGSFWDIDLICDPVRERVALALEKTSTYIIADIRNPENDFCALDPASSFELLNRELVRIDQRYVALEFPTQTELIKLLRKWQHFWDEPVSKEFSQRFLQALIAEDAQLMQNAISFIAPEIERLLRATVHSASVTAFGGPDMKKLAELMPTLKAQRIDRLNLGECVELLHLLADKLDDETLERRAAGLRPFVPVRNDNTHGNRVTSGWDAMMEVARTLDGCFPEFYALLKAARSA